MMQELLYSLWDLGLQVGHSLRSLDDCVAMARTDFHRAALDAGGAVPGGDRRLFGRFGKVAAGERLPARLRPVLETNLDERDQRYRRYGASPYIGEPNVKSRGRTARRPHRDVLGAAKFGARTLRELLRQGLITRASRRHRRGPDLPLARTQRAPLLLGHKNDVLSRDLPAADREEPRLRER